MPPELYHLVYQSFATLPMSEPELERVLAQSRAWNSAHGLTGILLYSDGGIMQVLEGARNEVQAIFARISRDNRHAHVVKLADGPIKHRQFEQWSMGFKAVNPTDFVQLKGYLDPANPMPMTPASVADAGLYAILAAFVAEDVIRF
ncbi:BLUF domain-containing protein [Hymenobacter sp. UYCo722]|uniref:BLUF domain-containing protein n=1 Tax=Hymenobacter sp. UYCo722 TaxID=3156335 RepID=UPI00339143D3